MKASLRAPAKYGTIEFLIWVIMRWEWVAFVAVQPPVLLLLLWGWRKCRAQSAVLGRLVSAAALLTLSYQAVAYVVEAFASNAGVFISVSRLPYPFLTYGGTALVLDFALLGLLLSVFRNGSIVRDDETGRSHIPRIKAGKQGLPC